ncbi:unnamed protein product [Paramecium primaurelia]|uniref:Pentapeptide repeat-containing protein n=1 Tax=Paramecium primaurelia TaxID=5886 RepID=A0A8S1NLC0_PARPR|nr:unnamed protein product [Paramecium primaurelia]
MENILNFKNLAIDLWNFSESLAIDMTLHYQTYFSHKVQGVLKLINAQECIGSLIIILMMNQKSNIIKRKFKAAFCQVAKVILFFIHKFIRQSLNKNKFQHKSLEQSVYNQDIFNISKIHFYKVSEFITNFFQQMDSNSNKENTQFIKEKLNYKRAPSNSVFLLSQFKASIMGGQDLRDISISDTKINCLSFFASDLQSSKFSGVELNGCNFNLSKIKNSKWSIICNE